MSEDTAEKFEGTPFGKPLERTEYESGLGEKRLTRFKDDPNKLVHLSRTEVGESTQEAIQRFSRAREVFEKLEEYGIFTPRFEVILAPPTDQYGQSRVYTVRDNIFGKSLEEQEIGTGKAALPVEKVDVLFSGLVRFYRDVYREGGDFLIDITPAQFVYGRASHDKKPKIYLVDVEAKLRTFNKGDPDAPQKFDLFTNIEILYDVIKDLENKRGIELEQTREVLEDSARSFEPRGAFKTDILRIKRKILGEKNGS